MTRIAIPNRKFAVAAQVESQYAMELFWRFFFFLIETDKLGVTEWTKNPKIHVGTTQTDGRDAKSKTQHQRHPRHLLRYSSSDHSSIVIKDGCVAPQMLSFVLLDKFHTIGGVEDDRGENFIGDIE